jgi:hypothetical protein
MEPQTEESERIAALTAGAIQASGEKVCRDILAAVEAAEQTACNLREEAERIIEKFNTDTGSLAARISAYIRNCQAAKNSIQLEQLKLFEMDDKPAPEKPRPSVDDILKSLATNGSGQSANDMPR